MASCENKYITLLDLSRQAKVITGETACFDGKIQVGLPFSGYPTGVDTGTTVSLGIVSSETAVFSGNTGTTIFDVSNTSSPNYDALFSGYSGTVWTNDLFSGNTSGLTLPITPLSADTQIVGPFWTLTKTGMTGDYVIGTEYTGYSITYSVSQLQEISFITGFTAYSGFSSASQENFSAGTLDYKGPLDYISSVEDATIDGRLTTNKLTVTGGASASTIGYVLTQLDETGKAGWVFNSSSATTDTSGAFTSTTANNRIIPTNTLSNSVSSDNSSILGGDGNTINTNSGRSIIAGGRGNDVEGSYSFIGNGMSNSISGRGYWNTVINGESNDLSLDPSSNYNTVVGNSHSITGTSLVANSILGGQNNNIHTRGGSNPINSSVVGGSNNTVYGPDNVVIIGGEGNLIDLIPDRAVIAGGNNNKISGESDDSFIGGGDGNIIDSSGFRNSIVGGQNNSIEGVSISNSVIIGGNGISGTTSNTVYVPNLNIGTIGTGTSVNNLGIDVNGNVVSGSTYTGNTSGDCISDLYLTNLYGCSPLHIEPSGVNDVYIVENGGNVGIGTTTPTEKLNVSGGDILIEYGTGKIFSNLTNPNEPIFRLSGGTTDLCTIGVSSPSYGGVSIGVRGSAAASPGFGKNGDGFLYSSEDQNGLNIISQDSASGTDDYIRFYAGKDAISTSDIHIQGSGTTGSVVKGNIGINNESPTSKIDIIGTTGYQQLRLRTDYTPTSAADTNGDIGDVCWDDDYFYVKTNNGWGRTTLDYGF